MGLSTEEQERLNELKAYVPRVKDRRALYDNPLFGYGHLQGATGVVVGVGDCHNTPGDFVVYFLFNEETKPQKHFSSDFTPIIKDCIPNTHTKYGRAAEVAWWFGALRGDFAVEAEIKYLTERQNRVG